MGLARFGQGQDAIDYRAVDSGRETRKDQGQSTAWPHGGTEHGLLFDE